MLKIIKPIILTALISINIFVLKGQSNAPVNTGSAAAPSQPVNPIPIAYAAGSLVNYLRTWEPQQPMTVASTVTSATSVQQVHMTTQYVDGLGRPLQDVNWQLSPNGQDVVQPIVYDALGRETYNYLLYSSPSANDGNIKSDPFNEQNVFYSSTYPSEQPAISGERVFYSQNTYEASPLDRIINTMAQGNSWAGSAKGLQSKYLTNTGSDLVLVWSITNNSLTYTNNDVTTNIPTTSSASTYVAGTLLKSVTINELGHAIVDYKDIEGREILRKVQVGNTIPTDYSGQDVNWLCTYYVYDNLNQLRFVIPPKVVLLLTTQSWTIDAASINELCYRYEYDYRQRMIAKKIPGAAWVYMVYDLRDRITFTQDGNLRLTNQWNGNIYDILNRTIETGMLTYTGTPLALQNYVSSISGNVAATQTITGTLPGSPSSFSATLVSLNNAVPAGATFVPLAILNHDNYAYTSKTFSSTNNSKLTQGTNPYADPVQSSASLMLLGHTTTVLTRVIENPANLTLGVWLESANFYDDKGRVAQVQNTNYKGGLDVNTYMYNFVNKTVCSYIVHNNPAAGISNFRIKTNLNFDNANRVANVAKNLNDDNNASSPQTTQRTIAAYTYDALGQLKEKKIGQKTLSGAAPSASPLEDETYTENIRGWLRGINWQGYGSGSTSSSVNYQNNKWFGMDVGYDWGYANNQLTGNISGESWVNGGDGVQRAFGFNYDNADRLLLGDFYQNFGGTWAKADPSDANFNINFSVKVGDGISFSSAYDANGNILAMQQNAMILNSSQLLDNLAYSYNSNSNKLNAVSDVAVQPANMNLGDFVDRNTSGSDYGFDVNGNLVTDKNKYINGNTGIDQTSGGAIVYNHMNLPFQVNFQNSGGGAKGNLTFIYDAAGNKLEKRINELPTSYNGNQSIQTVSTYLDGFCYQNNVLQYFAHDEGRVRIITPNVYNNNQSYAYDYFAKDNLGNTRGVLTDELQQDVYPAATLEMGWNTTENTYYNITSGNIVANPPSLTNPTNQTYVNNNGIANPDPGVTTTATSSFMYHLNGATGDKIGLGITLKVMAGDNVTIFGRTFWHNNAGAINNTSYNVLVNSLLTLIGNSTAVAASQLGATAATLNSSSVTPLELTNYFRNNEPSPTATPKAYINWILFDEQFRPVTTSGASGFIPVNSTADQISAVVPQNISIPKGGFLYVYCSNESNMDVYFDNLQVINTRGPLLETTNYYPFGLTMAGISDKAIKTNYFENKYRYNGKELQNKEFSDGLGMEEYDFGARFQDPQLGRFFTQDRFASKYFQLSPYQYSANNPATISDENGDSLIIGGSTSENQSFQKVANTGLGNVITVSPTSTGRYVFNTSAVAPAGVDAETALDAAKSLMTPGQAAFADVLNNAMNAQDPAGNPVDTKFTVVDGSNPISKSVFIGDNGISSLTATPGVHTLDIGDMQALGSTGILTAQGAMAHEISEGTAIQSSYSPQQLTNASARNRDIESSSAHSNFGIPAEDRINGTQSQTGNLNGSGKTRVLSIPVIVGGVTKTVTVKFRNGNITSVKNNFR